MIKHFLRLEWKSFTRSASFGANIALKILMGFVALYFTVLFVASGVLVFFLIKEELHADPLLVVNRFLIYYFVLDIIIRLLLQKIPVMNIRPLLTLPIKKSSIVNFALGKTALSFFNIMHLFFFIPFTVVLLLQGYDPAAVMLWFVSILSLIYINNFLNILLNNKDSLFIVFLVIVGVMAGLQYYGFFVISDYTAPFFNAIIRTYWVFAIPVVALIALYAITYRYFFSNLKLDTGLSVKHDVARTEQYSWLNQFGTLGTFLKNDIRLIRRNKRSKTTLFMSVLFLFYGLLFFSNGIEAYNSPVFKIFAGIFVTGGFLFTFGQFVPSWDSAYYQLMMTQNISYREYLNAKWWLIVIATVLSTLLATFYLYFGWHVYLAILTGAVYNIGCNSHLVLLGGAYVKTPIDLASGKGAFGDKKAFNVQSMLLTIPKLILPLLFYAAGHYTLGPAAGFAFVALAGLLGFAFRNKVFAIIERVYKTQKYSTIQAYKQNK